MINAIQEGKVVTVTCPSGGKSSGEGVLVDSLFGVAVKDAGRKRVAAEGEGRPDSPFSPAIQVGDFLYLSGFVGRGAEGFAAGDVAAQTRQTLARLEATLKAAGMDFSNVVNAQVYLTDIRHYAAMNGVYAELLPKPPPARATVGAPLMSPDALVEIMMIAAR